MPTVPTLPRSGYEYAYCDEHQALTLTIVAEVHPGEDAYARVLHEAMAVMTDLVTEEAMRA